MRPCVRASTLLHINISESSGRIATKFYLKHHWGGGKTSNNLVSTLAPPFLIGSSSYLHVTTATIISLTSSNSARFDQGLRS